MMKHCMFILAFALFLPCISVNAQFAHRDGPYEKSSSLERCQLNEAGCEAGYIQVKWPVTISNSCARPSYYPNLIPEGAVFHTVVRILVSEQGEPIRFVVENSSGLESLDSALLAAARSCRFQPGTRGGRPAALEVVWGQQWTRVPRAFEVIRVVPPIQVSPKP